LFALAAFSVPFINKDIEITIKKAGSSLKILRQYNSLGLWLSQSGVYPNILSILLKYPDHETATVRIWHILKLIPSNPKLHQ
jgi:hypothetical protein